jgi:iron complex transport system substrate-binding protein
VEIVDATGRNVRLDGPATRILSLVPSATLTLHAIGADDLLVGRTDYDDEPWVSGLPSVGGGLEPNLETIVTLRPDLVVRFAGSQDRRTPQRLDDLGIPHVAVRPDGIADVLETVRLLGQATGRPAEADSLVTAIRSDLARLEARVAPLPRKSVAYVLGGTPPWVAGPGTYIHELVTLVGGDNVFADLDALYAPVSPEEVRSRRIEVVLVSGVESFDRSLAPEARIEIVDEGLEIPGPDLATSAHRLAELLHGPFPRFSPDAESPGP